MAVASLNVLVTGMPSTAPPRWGDGVPTAGPGGASGRRWCRFGTSLALVLAASAGMAAEPPSAEPDGRRYLFVDDGIIATKSGVERELGKVTKANGGRPIFDGGWFYGTVMHDQGRFRMWYRKPSGGYGYAESIDGIHFEIKGAVTGINFAGDFNLAVQRNRADAPPDKRLIAGYDAPGMAAGIAYSADGLQWTPYNAGQPVTFRAADCHNQVLWDADAGTYRLFTRTDYGTGGGPFAMSVARDFEVRGTREMVNPDIDQDPTHWTTVRQWYFNREGDREYLRRQIYSMTDWIYHGVHFGLMSVYEYPSEVSEGRVTDHATRHERDVMNFYIAPGRDADDWDLSWVYAGRPLVPRGPDGAFDKDIVFPSSRIVTHDDRHWIYYGGANERHGTAELDPPVWFESRRAIGLATIRLDRFVALTAGRHPGRVVTRRLQFDGTELHVNVDARGGQVRCEVLDANGSPISGFSGDDALVATNVDDIRFRPRFRPPNNLADLQGQTVRLRFELKSAKLYAFQINR